MSVGDSSEGCLVSCVPLPRRAGGEAHSNYDFSFGTNLTPFPFSIWMQRFEHF